MKKSIVKRISVSGVIVVVTAMFIFSIVTILLYKTSMENNINKQLVIENRIAYNLLLVDKLDDAAVYKFLSESQNLVYRRNKNDRSLNLIHSTRDEFNDLEIEKILKDYINEGKNVIRYDIKGQKYLLTISTNRTEGMKANSIIVSFISTKEIDEMVSEFIVMMLFIAILLIIVATFMFTVISKRLTKPIVKVTEVTKEYENRNFEPEYIATTEDEIEELSHSVRNMAISIQQYDEDKEKLFRTISHEIKTPLTSIYGYAEGMKGGVFEDNSKALQVIMDESMRIKSLTEDYIFLSKLESNIESFDFKLNDVTPILERAITTIESLAIIQDIDIHYNPSHIEQIRCDEDKLYRALLNLLSNSIKYTKDLISIQVNDLDKELVIRIEDNGKGIEEEALDKFNKGLSSEKNNGSGVGLFITAAIIDKHTGSFNIGNNDQEGAYFEIHMLKE